MPTTVRQARRQCRHGRKWCGQCYEEVRCRRWAGDTLLLRSLALQRRIDMAKFVRRCDREGPSIGIGGGGSDTDFAATLPALWEHLTLVEWEPGSPRVPSSLLVFVEDGRWKACLMDKDAGQVGWRSSETFRGLLEALETALQGGTLDWRRARDRAGKGRR